MNYNWSFLLDSSLIDVWIFLCFTFEFLITKSFYMHGSLILFTLIINCIFLSFTSFFSFCSLNEHETLFTSYVTVIIPIKFASILPPIFIFIFLIIIVFIKFAATIRPTPLTVFFSHISDHCTQLPLWICYIYFLFISVIFFHFYHSHSRFLYL